MTICGLHKVSPLKIAEILHKSSKINQMDHSL